METSLNPGRLLLIAPPHSYRIAAYIEAAKKLNIPIEIASEGEYSLVSEIAGGLHVDLQNPAETMEKISQAHKELPFCGVVATDDYTVELASNIARTLGLPHNPPESARIARRKDLARQTLQRKGINVPKFKIIRLDHPLSKQLNGFPLPAVVKPLNLSASRGVIRVDDTEQFLQACEKLKHILESDEDPQTNNTVLLEQYLPGEEVAVEGVMDQGRFIPLCIFDKPEPLTGPYFEESYYITPSRHPQKTQEYIIHRVSQAAQAYGLQTGPVHAELRLYQDDAWILELAARTIGGECARLIHYGTGHSLEELVIGYALGRPMRIEAMSHSVGVLMIPTPKPGILRRVEGVLAAQQTPLIQSLIISVRDGHELSCLPDAASYLGFIFAKGDTPEAVEQALRTAHQKLKIIIDPLWKLGEV